MTKDTLLDGLKEALLADEAAGACSGLTLDEYAISIVQAYVEYRIACDELEQEPLTPNDYKEAMIAAMTPFKNIRFNHNVHRVCHT
jgi:hypothetical protein